MRSHRRRRSSRLARASHEDSSLCLLELFFLCSLFLALTLPFHLLIVQKCRSQAAAVVLRPTHGCTSS